MPGFNKNKNKSIFNKVSYFEPYTRDETHSKAQYMYIYIHIYTHTHIYICMYVCIYIYTVVVRIIATLGKYDQRRLWKLICIVNLFDILLKKNHKYLTFIGE